MSAAPDIIAALRRQIAAPLCGTGDVMPFGDKRIDAHLPGGGLPVGQLHEIGAEGIEAQTGAVSGGFAAVLAGALSRRTQSDSERILLWVATRCDLYAPGLLQYGVDPGRLILVQTDSDDETLAAMETALRSGAPVVVLGEVGRLGRLASRRLQLACLSHGSTGLVLRRWPHGRKPAPPEGNAAATRWRLRPVRGEKHNAGPPSWRVELLHARGGRPGAWIMQYQPRELDDVDAPDPLRVVAVLGDDTPAPCQAETRRKAS